MIKMILPIALVILANCFYHIISKKTPSNANVFLSLCITYTVAAVLSFAAFFVGNLHPNIAIELKKLNWTSFAFGVVLVGLELGYILTYRAGWDVNRAPLVANTCLAIALVFIGFIAFGEAITIKQIIGMAVCIVGLVIVTI